MVEGGAEVVRGEHLATAVSETLFAYLVSLLEYGGHVLVGPEPVAGIDFEPSDFRFRLLSGRVSRRSSDLQSLAGGKPIMAEGLSFSDFRKLLDEEGYRITTQANRTRPSVQRAPVQASNSTGPPGSCFANHHSTFTARIGGNPRDKGKKRRRSYIGVPQRLFSSTLRGLGTLQGWRGL